jgi:DNA (cytosine-5)-methyltransferase 1
VVDLSFPDSQTRRGRVIEDGEISPTLDTGCEVGVVEEEARIRKLTPKECFRLQGWADGYFGKAQFVNSDTQLYKQAGNGVTVNVIHEIAKHLT